MLLKYDFYLNILTIITQLELLIFALNNLLYISDKTNNCHHVYNMLGSAITERV